MATVLRRCVLAALGLVLATTGASARHDHHGFRGLHRLAGYHCPSGQYWRPSLHLCQGAPYRGERSRGLAASPPAGPVASAPIATQSPRRIVDTRTRIVDRRRQVSPDGVTVTYVVQTHVTERYPAPGPRRP